MAITKEKCKTVSMCFPSPHAKTIFSHASATTFSFSFFFISLLVERKRETLISLASSSSFFRQFQFQHTPASPDFQYVFNINFVQTTINTFLSGLKIFLSMCRVYHEEKQTDIVSDCVLICSSVLVVFHFS
jgi:hypothetical protein